MAFQCLIPGKPNSKCPIDLLTLGRKYIKFFDCIILETKLLKNEKHQTKVSLLLELVSDAYLTANRTRYMWSSTQETTPSLVLFIFKQFGF